MRAFLAFDVDQGVVELLRAAEEELRATRADVGIVAKENLHFTVKFLGEIRDETVPEIDDRIGALALSRCNVRLKGVGVFPDASHPRVVWAGLPDDDDAAKVTSLAESAIKSMDGIGRPEDHRYHPHVTLARVRSPRNRDALSQFVRDNAVRDFGTTEIRVLKLKSSVLTPRGPVYEDIREYVLK